MTLNELLQRLRGLLTRRRDLDDLDEELAFHLEMETEASLRAGLDRKEASRHARIRLGGVAQVRESYRDQTTLGVLEKKGQTPDGNDQESSSESMQFHSSLIHWGEITGNKAIRDLGIYLYTTEQSAIEEYYWDVNNQVFQPELLHTHDALNLGLAAVRASQHENVRIIL